MPRQLHCSVLCAITLAVLGASGVSAQSPPQVTLNTGILEGIRVPAAKNEVAFLGVPYAAPPVGNLRWKPPQPPLAWSGTRRAVQFGAACPQLPVGWLPYPAWNEDCLFLNVWTTSLSTKAALPVIIYFHGGSNQAGYSQLHPLGTALSPMGVVVITANYRLGPFGFLALPALTAESPHHSSGNYGLLDQIQALKWVRENIAHFGGDPARVTIMGQSAGAFDICLLMASPLARGLFHQAIMESGDCSGTLIKDIRTPIPYNEISGTGEADGERLAAGLGIGNGANQLRKLRSIPADTILKTWSKAGSRGDPEIQFDATVDGWVVPVQPATIFAEDRQARVPVLVGSNADEATVFGPGPATVAAYKKYLREDTGEYSEQEFTAWPASSDAQVHAQYLKLQSDTFAYGAWSMARAQTRAGQPAYLFRFTWTETGDRARLGAYHGEELSFLSNEFPRNWGASSSDHAFSETLQTYWTDFAKTGNPNHAGLPQWPAYDPRFNQIIDLGRTIQLRPAIPQLSVMEKILEPILAMNSFAHAPELSTEPKGTMFSVTTTIP